MQDIFDQLKNLLKGFWQHRWAAISVAWLVAIIGWSAIFFIPNVYTSSAKVYADTDTVLRPLLEGIAVEPNMNSRLAIVTRELLTWPNLEKVMRETDMDLDVQTEEEKERLLMSLEERIGVKSARGTDLYTFTYRDKDPQRAKDVVQALVDIFFETMLSGKRLDSDSAEEFLQAEVEEYESKLELAEQKLRDFKIEHKNAIRGQEYFSRLSTLQTQLQDAQFELNLSSNRVAALQQQLNSFRRDAASNTASPALITSVDLRLKELRTSLDDMLLRYTEEHPTVIETRASIGELEKQREQELKELSQSGGDAGTLRDNVLYQELRLAISEAQARAAEARVSVAEYQRRIAEMESVVETLPQIEAQLAALNRDYEANKERYDSLVLRRESAKISGRVDASGDGVKLRTMEPPRVPLTPSGPNRFLLTTLVLFASLATAFGLAFLLGELKPVIYDIKGLREAAGLPVLGSITVLDSMRHRYGIGKRSIAIFAGAGVLFIASYVTVLLVQTLYFENIRSMFETVGSYLS